ncbi:hypothetical protein ACVWXN_005880 [Bradyrhizobium sp. i1.4.4]
MPTFEGLGDAAKRMPDKRIRVEGPCERFDVKKIFD